MQKNWFKIGREDYLNGRVSLSVVLWFAGAKEAMAEYCQGHNAAKKQNCIPFYSDGPGENRIARYYQP